MALCSQGWAQQKADFLVYCSSNMDGTGNCVRDDNSETLACVLIPGGIIDCRDQQQLRYQCVQFGFSSANNTQLAFSCSRGINGHVNGQQPLGKPIQNLDGADPLPSMGSPDNAKEDIFSDDEPAQKASPKQELPLANPYLNGSVYF